MDSVEAGTGQASKIIENLPSPLKRGGTINKRTSEQTGWVGWTVLNPPVYPPARRVKALFDIPPCSIAV